MRKAQNWNQPCPNKDCEKFGQLDKGNISSISTYNTKSGKRRTFKCGCCETQFSETRDTVFFDLRVPRKMVIMVLKMILVKVGLSDIAFVTGITEETILRWLDRAATKADEINQALLREVNATQVQLDEMWSFVLRKISEHAKDGNHESPQESEDGRQWVWISYAPEFRLILAVIVGPRTYETALTLIQRTAYIIKGIPAFFSDGFSCYLKALIECYYQIKTFIRTGERGRPKNPVKEAHPDLIYGQVVKERKGGRIAGITYRIRCGAERIVQLGLKVSTSLFERLNLTFRQSLAPLVRKSLSFSKVRRNLQKQVTFFQAFYNVARPHMSLREQISEPGVKFKQVWQQRTPAMAAGLTDHVWTFEELLNWKNSRSP